MAKFTENYALIKLLNLLRFKNTFLICKSFPAVLYLQRNLNKLHLLREPHSKCCWWMFCL